MTEHSQSHTDEVAEVLRDQILRGQYRAGERLPSERDLAARFRVNRGAVREALKKLEQLGIASVQPGGARVVPLEEASLDVLGPLLDLQDLPDPYLVDQTLEVMGALMALAARQAVERADAAQMAQAIAIVARIEDEATPQLERINALRDLMLHFVEVSNNLVIRLIGNGLKTQFLNRLQVLGLRPTPDLTDVAATYRSLSSGLSQRDGEATARAMQQLNRLMQKSLVDSLAERTSTATANGKE